MGYIGHSVDNFETIEDRKTHTGDGTTTKFGVLYSDNNVSVFQNGIKLKETTDYSTDAYSVAFAVSDDLSISYGNMEDTREAKGATAALTAEMTSYQIAYTMGSMALKFAHTDTDNGYHSSSKSAENTEIAVSFSF